MYMITTFREKMLKRELIVTFLLILPLFCYAQSFSVVSFTELKTDLKARTEEVLDINGNPCSLVRVVLPISDVSFHGWVNKQSAGTGEYLVYVAEGTKRITVRHSSFYPFVYEFPTKMIGKHTYQLVLKTEDVNDSREALESAIFEKDRKLILNYIERLRTAYVTRDSSFFKLMYDNNEKMIIVSGMRDYSDEQIRYRKMEPSYYRSTREYALKNYKDIEMEMDNIEIFQDATNKSFYNVSYTQKWNSDSYHGNTNFYQLWDFTDPNKPHVVLQISTPVLDNIDNQEQNFPHPTYLEYMEYSLNNN